MNYKHVLPIEWNYHFRHFFEWRRRSVPQCKPKDLENEKRIFFLDTPSYGNIGDQAIAYAMEVFMADLLPDYAQIEITEDQIPACQYWLKRNINNNDIICLTGGGNMGITYQRYESVRRLIMKMFPDNRIIVFPQTFDYDLSFYAKREKKRAAKVYSNVKKLILCARDEKSFLEMKKVFNDTKVLFCPDIVLYLDYRNIVKRTNETGLCFRSDRESVLSEYEKKRIVAAYPTSSFISTESEDNVMISHKNRKSIIEKKIKEFGSKKLVVTDRLHGVIFSYITNTPCVALQNSNKKIERVCSYLSKKGSVVFLKTYQENAAEIKEKRNDMFYDEFEELKQTILACAKN